MYRKFDLSEGMVKFMLQELLWHLLCYITSCIAWLCYTTSVKWDGLQCPALTLSTEILTDCCHRRFSVQDHTGHCWKWAVRTDEYVEGCALSY